MSHETLQELSNIEPSKDLMEGTLLVKRSNLEELSNVKKEKE